MNFNFNFGNKKPDKKQIIIVSVVVTSIIATLSQCTGMSQNNIWDLLDEVHRKYFPGSIFGELIRQDPEKLDRRIKRDVGTAVDNYWQQSGLSKAEVYKPRYVEEKNDETVCYTKECKSLAPPMRLCAPWVDNCPKN